MRRSHRLGVVDRGSLSTPTPSDSTLPGWQRVAVYVHEALRNWPRVRPPKLTFLALDGRRAGICCFHAHRHSAALFCLRIRETGVVDLSHGRPVGIVSRDRRRGAGARYPQFPHRQAALPRRTTCWPDGDRRSRRGGYSRGDGVASAATGRALGDARGHCTDPDQPHGRRTQSVVCGGGRRRRPGGTRARTIEPRCGSRAHDADDRLPAPAGE